MIRLFIAVDLPEDIQALICTMGGTIPGSRPVSEDQLHLTLKFIGDVESGAVSDIKSSLLSIQSPSFKIQLKGVGHFPPRGAPKVLWAGIDPITEVTVLRNRIEKELSRIGIAREKRRFAPHVTLARLRNSPLKKVTQFLSANSLFDTPPFLINEFKLYSSTLTGKGAIHTVQEVIPLEA